MDKVNCLNFDKHAFGNQMKSPLVITADKIHLRMDQYARIPVSVPSLEGSAVVDAAAAAGGTRTGRGGGCAAGSRRAAAAGSAAACSRGGAGRAAPPWRRGAARRRARARLRRAPAAPSARCHPTAMTTFAAASLRSACLELNNETIHI